MENDDTSYIMMQTNDEGETPLGEQIDGGGDEYDFSQYDDDPNPYAGTFSED